MDHGRKRRFGWLLAGTLAVAAGGAAPAPDDVDFLFRLGMLEGHLIVGHDLLQAGQPALAAPHFGHPVRELYDDIEFVCGGQAHPAV